MNSDGKNVEIVGGSASIAIIAARFWFLVFTMVMSCPMGCLLRLPASGYHLNKHTTHATNSTNNMQDRGPQQHEGILALYMALYGTYKQQMATPTQS